jgi:hypothetical protein
MENIMNKMMTTILAAGFLIAVLGCSQPADDKSVQASASPVAEQIATPAAGKVTVEADGSKFDPAVPVEQMPDGAWACVMGGTVHYASMEEGDGKCDICKMKLLKQGSSNGLRAEK